MRLVALLCAGILSAVVALQLLLALGAPLGQAAWGGRHRVLPLRLRCASLGAAAILAGAAWVTLARAGMAPPGPRATPVRFLAWVLAGLFALNTLGNLASASRLERRLMATLTALLTAGLLLLSLRGA